MALKQNHKETLHWMQNTEIINTLYSNPHCSINSNNFDSLFSSKIRGLHCITINLQGLKHFTQNRGLCKSYILNRHTDSLAELVAFSSQFMLDLWELGQNKCKEAD